MPLLPSVSLLICTVSFICCNPNYFKRLLRFCFNLNFFNIKFSCCLFESSFVLYAYKLMNTGKEKRGKEKVFFGGGGWGGH